MNPITPRHPVAAAPVSTDSPATPSEDDAVFEQQMAEMDLSAETRRFLRSLHAAEKHLNDAFERAHEGAGLEQCVSQCYHDLYGSDDSASD